MPGDAFTISYLAAELDRMLSGARVNRITQPETDEVVLHLYGAGNFRLLISCNAQYPRCHLTEHVKENPKDAFPFLMTLRKHLSGGTLTSVESLPSERIIRFRFSSKNELKDREDKLLTAELMGKHSNIILTDENQRILGCAKTVSFDTSSVRQIITGLTYSPPPAREGFELGDREAALQALSDYEGGGTSADFASKCARGISYATAREAAHRAELDDRAALTQADRERLAGVLAELPLTPARPCIVKEGGKVLDYFAFPYLSVTSGEREDKPTLSGAADDYFYLNDKYRRFGEHSRTLLAQLKKHLGRLTKKKALLLERLHECEKAEELRIKGELITANIYRLKGGETSVSVQNYYEEGSPEVVIKLDNALSPAKNAQAYFKRYAKLRNGGKHAGEQLEACEKELSYLLSVEHSFSMCSEARELAEIAEELAESGYIRKDKPAKGKKQAAQASRPLRFEIGGFTVYAGKNNTQNDRLTFGTARVDDVWLHASKFHGAHVIIVAEGRKVPDEVIKAAAEIAAHHSGAREAGKVPVDYALKKHVKKPSGSAPGFVTYTDHSTAIAVPSAHTELLKGDGD